MHTNDVQFVWIYFHMNANERTLQHTLECSTINLYTHALREKKRLQNEIHLKMKYITKRKKNDLEKIALKNGVFLFNRRSCVDLILQCVLFCPVLVLFAFYKPLQLALLNSFFIAFVCSSLHIICISVAFRRWAWMLRKRNSHKDCMRWSFRRAATTSTIIRGNSKMFISLCSISHL